MTQAPEPPVPDDLPAISGQGKSEPEHWRWVLRKLGGGIVDIELTSPGDLDPLTGQPFPPGETHYDDCMEETKRWYCERVGFRKVLQIPLANGQTSYLLPPDIIEVIRIDYPNYQLPTLDADQFSYTYFSLLFGQWTNPNVAPLPYSDLVQRLQYLEEIGRIFSTDRDWEWTKETRTLEIMPPPASVNSGLDQALVTVWSWNIDTRVLDPQETGFFRRKLLAEAMGTLGNIRMTVDSWPSIAGDRTMNGTDLMSNAETVMEKLNQDILNWKRAVPIITG